MASGCVGVEYIHQGEVKTAVAIKEVILCGGALNSPQLLLLSGIGAARTAVGNGHPTGHGSARRRSKSDGSYAGSRSLSLQAADQLGR